MNNYLELERTNVLKWREQGYTGKGVKVAVFDSYPLYQPFILDYCIVPQGMTIKVGENMFSHSADVAKTIHEVAPEAEIWIYSGDGLTRVEQIQSMIDNKIDIIVSSIAYTMLEANTEWYTKLMASNIPMVCTAGNSGKSPVNWLGTEKWTLCVGATSVGTENRVSYSNFGEELDVLAYTAITVPIIRNGVMGTKSFNGTSAACPFAGGLAAIYTQWLKEQGKNLTREELHNLAKTYAKDIDETGKDFYTGWGIMCLPKEVVKIAENIKIEMQLDNKTAYVNGNEVVLDVPPTLKNNRTMLPIRFIAEALNCKVEWVADERKIIITK